MKGTMKRIVTFALAVMMVLSVAVVGSPIEAQAAGVNKVTTSTDYKKAKALKVGNNAVSASMSATGFKHNYLKFTASKAGTYTFTISGITSTKNTKTEIGYGSMYLYELNKYGYTDYMNVYTNKAKVADKIGTTKTTASGLGVTTFYCWNKWDRADYKKSSASNKSYVYTRYIKVKLSKGQTVYMDSSFSGKNKKYTYNVNIKRK